MHPHLLIAVAAALCLALTPAETSVMERSMAAAGLLLCFITERRRDLLILGIALGCVGAVRIELRRVESLSLDGREGVLRFQTGSELRGRARSASVWIGDGGAVPAWIHFPRGEIAPAHARGSARAQLWGPAPTPKSR